MVAVSLALAVPTPATADGARFVDYLFLEPNEGGASAGHVALAFADRTYDYQRSPDGLVLLERNDSEHYRYRYAVLGNRAVHRSRIAVTAPTFERLREGFNRRYLVQQRQLAVRDGLTADRRLLARLLHRPIDGAVPDGLPIEAAGYFVSDASGSSAALATLRARVAATYGPAIFRRRIEELRTRAAATTPRPEDLPPATLALDVYPEGGDSFAARYAAPLGGIVALEILQRDAGLDPGSTLTVEQGDLDAAERRALARYASRLENDLSKLVASARPDFGFPLLVGMARLLALERSLALGRLVVLDAFPIDGPRLAHDVLARAPDVARGLLDDARDDLLASRRAFVAAVEPGERAYVQLENAANRAVELEHALAERRGVRLARDVLVPTRPASRTQLVTPDVDTAVLRAALESTEAAADAYQRSIVGLYRYDLLRRNCVTELFATIDAVLGQDAGDALGGRLAADRGWRFIPSVATRAVDHTWRIVATDTTPSYRQARVAALAREGRPFLVRLRESNTLTSTVYRRSRDDSTFLFFTDDAPFLRPVLGAANLAVGVGAGAIGLLQAPMDRGEALRAGLLGVLWSIPELAFMNVRKGSFDHVDRHELPDAPAWRAAAE